MERNDTIVAPATPSGEGGVGIVRVSGPESEFLLKKLFRGSCSPVQLKSHYLYHGYFYSSGQELIDEVMAVVMRKPRSYTREDVVEVHCHGGHLVITRILESFIEAGARFSDPGEFTLRAFLNGRIDLTEAEAVIDIIRARSEKAAKNAVQHLQGSLSGVLGGVRRQLVDLLVLVEAYLDFPEEDISLPHFSLFKKGVEESDQKLQKLLNSFNFGRILKEGLSVLLLGRPNVGKSSLLNFLLGENRAIVTDVPGTTRDIIEENLTLSGFPLKLIDTAGVRETSDPVESEGVRRTRQKVDSVDLVLLVINGSVDLTADDYRALEVCPFSKTIVVVNKVDIDSLVLPDIFCQHPVVKISAKTGQGIENLEKSIVEHFSESDGGFDSGESVILSSERHRESLIKARSSLSKVTEGMKEGLPFECLATDLGDAIHSLGEVTGETLSEEVLNQIFSRFCIGK